MLRRWLRTILLRIMTLFSVVVLRRVAPAPAPEDLRCPAACVQIRVATAGVTFVCLDGEDARGLRRCPGAIMPQPLVGVRYA